MLQSSMRPCKETVEWIPWRERERDTHRESERKKERERTRERERGREREGGREGEIFKLKFN